MPAFLHASEPGVVVGRLALALDRQRDGGLHRRGALGQDRGTAVVAGRRARGHHHVGDAVELDGGLGDLGELRRRLALDGAAGGERLADGAELAGLGAALIADAGLQHRGGEHVAAVQHRDLPIGDAVRGHAVVEARAHREARPRPASRRRGSPGCGRARPACRRSTGSRRPARCGPAPSRSCRRWSSPCGRTGRRRRGGSRGRPWDQRAGLRRTATR